MTERYIAEFTTETGRRFCVCCEDLSDLEDVCNAAAWHFRSVRYWDSKDGQPLGKPLPNNVTRIDQAERASRRIAEAIRDAPSDQPFPINLALAHMGNELATLSFELRQEAWNDIACGYMLALMSLLADVIGVLRTQYSNSEQTGEQADKPTDGRDGDEPS